MPKCASTTLQRFFAENASEHRAAGLCYPQSWRSQHGYRSHRPLSEAPAPAVGRAVDQIAREAEDGGCDTIVLSSEAFTGLLWDQETPRLVVTALNERFGSENVTVLLLVRNHFKFVESCFAQFVWGGMFRVPMDTFFARADNGVDGFIRCFREMYGFDFFAFSRFVELLRGQAPRNRIDIQSIEREDLGPAGLIGWLCDHWHLPVARHDVEANARASEGSLRAMHHARTLYDSSQLDDRRRLIRRSFRDVGGRSPMLHLSGDLVHRVSTTVNQDALYFESIGTPLTDAVTTVPEGFPRVFSSEGWTVDEYEDAAVRYLVEDSNPKPAIARAMIARSGGGSTG